MASLSRIPVIELLGIQPSGMNASSSGERLTWRKTVKAYQEALFRKPLTTVLQVIQCDMYGQIDPDIGFTFKPAVDLDELAAAALRKTEAETATIHLANNTITKEEERTRLAADPDAPYASLDLSKTPPSPPDEAAQIAQQTAAAVAQLFGEAVIDRATALRMVKENVPGLGDAIDNADIAEAEEEPPTPSPEELVAQAKMVKAKSGDTGGFDSVSGT
jgi:hypothetical protein